MHCPQKEWNCAWVDFVRCHNLVWPTCFCQLCCVGKSSHRRHGMLHFVRPPTEQHRRVKEKRERVRNALFLVVKFPAALRNHNGKLTLCCAQMRTIGGSSFMNHNCEWKHAQIRTIRGSSFMDVTVYKGKTDDQQRSCIVVHSETNRHPSPPSYPFISGLSNGGICHRSLFGHNMCLVRG